MSSLNPPSFFSPYRNPRLEDGPDGEYLTERLTDEALSLLEGFGDERFLLWLSYYTVHVPLQAPEPDVVAQRARIPQVGVEVHQLTVQLDRKVVVASPHGLFSLLDVFGEIDQDGLLPLRSSGWLEATRGADEAAVAGHE